MRVLQLGRFWDTDHGGIERHAALLCSSLSARGVDVVNLVAAPPGMATSDEQINNYRLVRARSYGLFARTALSPALVSQALKLHREKPFDIVHLHFPDPLSHLVGLALPGSVKRVITWHSDIFQQKFLLNLYLPWLQRFICKADAVIAGSQFQFKNSTQLPRYLSPAKRHVIPLSFDAAALELTPRIAAMAKRLRNNLCKTQGDQPLVFALGRHVYYKGFDVLVRAIANVAGRLVIGGNGPLHAALQAQVESLGLSHKVCLPGRIPEEDLAAYYYACDVFCMPSIQQAEAFGLVQLEAMACGKPVVCTQLHNGVNEVNPNGISGLTVPPGDDVALAAALNHLFNDPALRLQLGQQARHRASHQYSLSAMGARHVALYDGLLNPARAGVAAQTNLITSGPP